MKISDNIDVKDGFKPIGVVTLFKDGKVLFKVNNLVTEHGRKFIMSKVFGDIVGDAQTFSDYDGFELSKIGFGSGGEMTRSSDISLVSEIETARTDISDFNITLDSMSVTFNIDNINVGNSSQLVQELGLFLEKEGEDPKLFSRVVFDPIPVDPDSTYSIEYTLWF